MKRKNQPLVQEYDEVQAIGRRSYVSYEIKYIKKNIR